ncbi:MAG: PIN domain-containing protein [Acidobacteriota bacterium]
MNARQRLYLDTSVPSAYFDYSKPVRQLITQKWFENEAGLFQLYMSVITVEEIERLQNPLRRENIRGLLLDHHVDVLQVDMEARDLAEEYVRLGAIPQSEPEDALHVAIASVSGMEGFASWNFKHIVSANPIRKVHEINKKRNLPLIEIGSIEIFGGSKYGNL